MFAHERVFWTLLVAHPSHDGLSSHRFNLLVKPMSGTRRPKRPRASEGYKEVEHTGDGFARKRKGKGEDKRKGEDRLTEHAEMRKPAAESDWKCEVCGGFFSQKGHFNRHKAAASCLAPGEGKHKCEGCDRSFRRSSHLRRHKGTVQCKVIEQGNFECAVVGKINQVNKQLNMRMDALIEHFDELNQKMLVLTNKIHLNIK